MSTGLTKIVTKDQRERREAQEATQAIQMTKLGIAEFDVDTPDGLC